MERKWGNNVEEEDGANDTADGSSNDTENAGGPQEEPGSAGDASEQQEASYIETVRNIKQNKRHRRRQQQMRRRQQKQAEEVDDPVTNSDDKPMEKETPERSDGRVSSIYDVRTTEIPQAAVNGFAALSMMDSD